MRAARQANPVLEKTGQVKQSGGAVYRLKVGCLSAALATLTHKQIMYKYMHTHARTRAHYARTHARTRIDHVRFTARRSPGRGIGGGAGQE